MNWARRFRARQYIRGSLWILPLIGGLLGVALGELDVIVDKSLHLSGELAYSASTASTLLTTIVGAMAALTGFVVTVTTLVVQMATGTFSARYMRLWYRDRQLKALLAMLIGTLAFSFTLLRRVEADFVPNLGVSVAGVLVVGNAAAVPRVSRRLPAPAPTRGRCRARGRLRARRVPAPGARPGRRRRTSGWVSSSTRRAAHAGGPQHGTGRDPGDRRQGARAVGA